MAQQHLIAALEPSDTDRRPVPQRLILGTAQNLRDKVSHNQFREDLYFAISAAPLRLPPFARAQDDIPTLATHFCNRQIPPIKRIKIYHMLPLTALQTHDWPGNLRELDMFIRKLVMLASSDVIDAQDVSAELQRLPCAPRR